MTFKRIFLIISLFLTILFLQGCQIIRLLAFKNQLASFKNFVGFEDKNTIVLKKPVLEGSDILLITRSDPKTITNKGTTTTWTYHLQKQPITPKDDLKFQLIFIKKKLTKAHYPIQLAQLFSYQMVKLGFKSIGKGSFNPLNRVMNTHLDNPPTLNPKDLPNRAKITKRLGTPTSTSSNTTHDIWHYQYKELDANNKPKSSPWIKVYFKKNKPSISKLSGTIFGPLVSFNFD